MAGTIETFLTRHNRIGLDTPVFIYYLGTTPWYEPSTDLIMRGLERGDFLGLTSAVSLTEISVKPLQMGFPTIAKQYQNVLLTFPNLAVAPIDASVARIGAELRAAYRIPTPNALQLAACLANHATGFITNDRRLSRVLEIEVLVLEDVRN